MTDVESVGKRIVSNPGTTQARAQNWITSSWKEHPRWPYARLSALLNEPRSFMIFSCKSVIA